MEDHVRLGSNEVRCGSDLFCYQVIISMGDMKLEHFEKLKQPNHLNQSNVLLTPMLTRLCLEELVFIMFILNFGNIKKAYLNSIIDTVIDLICTKIPT